MSARLEEIEAAVPALRRYARALVRDPDRADDLVQDCLERALGRRMLWRPTGTVKSWLFKILLNLYRNDLRSRRRQAETVAYDDLAVEPGRPAEQPGRLALAEVAAALEKLPAEQREALLLVALEGLSYAEAADILGIPNGTLMSRLARAREGLRRLTGDGDGRPVLRRVT